MFQIRKTEPDDLQKIQDWATFNVQFLPTHVGALDGLVIGYINFSERTHVIYTLEIRPMYKRQGYARRMVDFLKKREAELEAFTVNDSAIPFWTAMGFVKDIARGDSEVYTWTKRKKQRVPFADQ